MEKYLIASGVVENYIFPEAYLFKIEIIEDGPPFYVSSSGRSSMFIKEDKSFLKNECGVVKCNLIRIKEILYRASIGDRGKSANFYDDQANKELEQANPFEIKPDRKIYYRKKLSRGEYTTFLNRKWVMPVIEDELLFEESSDKEAVKRFKSLLSSVYIGPLNEQINLTGKYSFEEDNYFTFITGKSNFISDNVYFKPSDDETWHFKSVKGYNSLYQSFEQDKYDYNDEINSTFWRKMNFVLAMANHTELNIFKEVYSIANEYYPKLAGFHIESAIFYGLNQMYTPRPIFPFDCCFNSTGIRLHNLITTDIKEFITNRNYFFMCFDKDSEIFKIPMQFISDDIIVKELTTFPSKEMTFKKFIEKEKGKK